METNQTEKLRITENFSDFDEFYRNSQDKIYRKILTVFEELYRTGYAEKQLIVSATIDRDSFDTCFKISRGDKRLLKVVLLQYFEKIEEYEICGRILEMDSNL